LEYLISIGDLAALVTVVGVTIYALGLIGLAVPIQRSYTHDFATAWNAVSLMPKTIVVGQGVRIWMQWPILLTVVILIEALVLRASTSEPAFITAVVASVTMSLIILIVYARSPKDQRSQSSWFTPFLPTIGGGFVGVGAGIIVTGSATAGIMLIFVGTLTAGIPIAMVAKPPLVKVRITQQQPVTIEGIPDPLEGWLVAHSDGYWHLFVVANKQRELLSIPDDKVLVARMGSEEAASHNTEEPRRGFWARLFRA
jgi:hypothetical protein